jgi:predicted MFS family arabinose efflux permease
VDTDRALTSYRQLLRTPDVRALLLATCLSRLAGRMFALTIVLYALALARSPVLAGWLAFASVAPGLVISPLAGALIDRAGSKWAITVDMVASAMLVAALVLADRLGGADAPVLLVLTGLFSLTSPLSVAGIRALLPRLVPVAALDRANALDTSTHGVSDVLGPALAGTLVGFGGPELALCTIAITYAAAAFCIGSISGPTGGRLPRLPALLRQALDGLARVVREPTLRGLAVSYALYEVAWGMLVIVVPVFATTRFGAGTADIIAGLLWAGLGVAGGIGALIAGHLRTAGQERQVIALGMLVTASAVWPLAAEFGLTGLVLGMMLVGAMAGPIDVGVLTLRQRRTDPAELGRVLSVSISLNMAGMPLGSAVAGVLVTWSDSATFAVGALASALGAAAVALIPSRDDRGPMRASEDA